MVQQRSTHRHVYSGVGRLFFYALTILASISLVNAAEVQSSEWLPQATETIKKQEKTLKRATLKKLKSRIFPNT